jgi:dihydrodipicolinate synthase/N-acetylneuraminate lyase
MFEGIFAATVTPMREDGEIALEVVAPLVERLVDGGIAGLVPCGGTGQFGALSVAERHAITRSTIQAAAGRIPVVPHTGSLTTRDTIELSVEAERAGAAGVMIAPPFLDPLSPTELADHYRRVAREIRIPIVLYNHPDATKVNITPALAAELATIEGVEHIKDSSGNAAAVAQLIGKYADRINLMTGADTMAYYAFVIGATSAIWGAANVAPRECAELYRLTVQERDLAGGLDLWRRLWPLMDALESVSYVAGVKYGTLQTGLDVGPPRLPLQPLDAAGRATVDDALLRLGAAAPV